MLLIIFKRENTDFTYLSTVLCEHLQSMLAGFFFTLSLVVFIIFVEFTVE